MDKEDYSPWFSYKDEGGAIISIHIPNLFIRVEEMDRRIKKLEKKNKIFAIDVKLPEDYYGNDKYNEN